ncbi:EAL domain-containing protein [Shewanella sp. FJAT-52076]|uniref:sensor domain-containing phosphodiesterase n=1 Tax=Shewanella sp. FJAT-52076 TaxID=2864202 RepID=UPI001C659F18|nr:EAL domain-containing protein [Shewanella sp. FJAT-52076]QYJ76987.1 EAL domain-containing protein [Shewanella sp. FJAT-52076]
MGRDVQSQEFGVRGYGGILAMVLEHRPLSEILHALTALIESQTSGTVASVLLLSEDGSRLLTGAAPGLPEEFNRIVHGAEIGLGVGSCGSAAFLGERVVVSDIATHEYWQPYNSLPLAAGLKSCWSEPIKDSHGKVIGTFALYHDTIKSPTTGELTFIAEGGKLAALAIERSRDQRYQQLVARIFNKMPMALAITDDKWQLLYKNPPFKNWFNPTLQAFEPEKMFDACSAEMLCQLAQQLQNGNSFSGEFTLGGNDVQERRVEVLVTPIADPQGDGAMYGWLMSDITERQKAAKLIEYQANYDSLTGLANRFLLSSSMASACAQSQPFWLFVMDLDRFKYINDSFGHHVGDELLRMAANRLQSLLPDNARLSALLSRVGGDEFALFLTADGAEPDALAKQLVISMSHPFDIEGRRLHSGISLGIARYPDDGLTPDNLFQAADQAMYCAKSAGRSTWRHFAPQMRESAARTATLTSALKEAIAADELTLVYQPIVDISSQRIIAAEALLRWRYEGEDISPVEFIPLAESAGLIPAIGELVRHRALKLIDTLCRANTPIKLSVNVSSFELWSDAQQACFLGSLLKHSIESTHLSWLILEITESLLLETNSGLIKTLEQLRQQGIWIAIDDFGTGYSSLAYLMSFPMDCIKLDKSFMATVGQPGKGEALTEAIIKMSHAMDLCVVAEGVEHPQQLEFLCRHQVLKAQGFLLHRPMDEAALMALLRAQN